MRNTLLLAATFGLLACKGTQVRPTSNNELPGTDISNCFRSAVQFDPMLKNAEKPGTFTLMMLVDDDGAVAASFVHDAKDIAATQFFACVTDKAIASKFPGEKIDYLRPQPIYVKNPNAEERGLKEQPVGEFDEALARRTLVFPDWAQPVDRAWGQYYVHDYPAALAGFRQILTARADDARALRGLAVTLVDSKGDLKEARDAANKAVKAAPDSEATNEALLKVCIAAKDDECAYDAFEKGRKAPDLQARSFELAQLQDEVKAAAERLKSGEESKRKEEEEKLKAAQGDAAKNKDVTGCGSAPEGDERSLCLAKYCFAKGAQAYATELKPMLGMEYVAGDWKTVKGKKGATMVTVQIRSKKKGGQPHDATWEMDLKDGLMKAGNIDASNISQKHNACAK